MDYRNFSIEDFVLDPFFRSWATGTEHSGGVFWIEWMDANPDKAAMIEEARKIVRGLQFSIDGPTGTEAGEVKDRVKEQLRLRQLNEKKEKGRRFYLYPLAASIAFLLLASVVVFFFIYSPKVNLSTGFSETRNLILPDGSKTVLNANSSISYSQNWDENAPREVWLEGEAFFEVEKMPQRENPKFVVYVGSLRVEVLGTAFNVYNRNGKASVVLKEGKVQLSSPGNKAGSGKLVMEPGDKVDFHNGSFEIEKVATGPYTSWKDHRMVFENMKLSEIAVMLEDNHGYRAVFGDPELKELRFTGSYSTGKIDILLRAIEESFDIQIMKDGKTITFQ